MKSILLSLAFFVFISIIFEEDPPINQPIDGIEIPVDKSDSLLEDGWYTATVIYSNHKKIATTTSELKVQVKNNQVVKIDLSNGKILEAGDGKSGYLYSGGVLNHEYDTQIKEKIFKTSVKIKEADGVMSFYEIRII